MTALALADRRCVGSPRWGREWSGQLRDAIADPMTRTTAALVGNTLVTSVLGLAFWVVASHRYSPREVGFDSALLSAMLLISTLTELNLSVAIPRMLPQIVRHRGRKVAGCYAVTTIAGGVCAWAFVAIAPHYIRSLSFIESDLGLRVAIVVGVIAFNIFAVQDAVLMACRWALLLPVENGLFGIVKLGLMFALAGSLMGYGIFYAWVIGSLIFVVAISALLFGTCFICQLRSRATPRTYR